MTAMNAKIMYAVCARAVSLVVLVWLPFSAAAFEVKRGTGATEQIEPAPSVTIDDGKKPLLEIDYCFGPIEPNLEEMLESSKMLVKLPVPFEKDGQAFRWQIGNAAGTTYWDRKPLDEGRHQIALYITTLDLMLKFPATTIRSAWSGVNDIDDKNQEWHSDLSLAFLDQPNNEVLIVSYLSHSIRVKAEDSIALTGAETRNTRIKRLDRGTLVKVCQISN